MGNLSKHIRCLDIQVPDTVNTQILTISESEENVSVKWPNYL